MTSVVSCDSFVGQETLSQRAVLLAERLEQGALALATFARGLTDTQWNLRLPGDDRSVGVIVHHVASVYPVEIQLAKAVAAGTPITNVTPADIDTMNAAHAKEFAEVGKEAALELLQRNSTDAAAAIRALSDPELNRAVPVSLYSDAPLTCQFVLEDHAVRHSYHHLARIRRAIALHASKGLKG